jgi:arylsulfatase A-like enzyme
MKPNILFLVIDSLRADKCYGNKKTSITPNIDSLINNGVYFTQALSSAAATAVAVSSMLTGLYPFNTGMGDTTYHKLDSKISNYIRVLKDHGYHTYSSAPEIATDFGLTYDFENVDSTYDNYFSLFAGLGDQIIKKFSSDKLQQPWFFYIHLFDLHTPVIVPDKFSEEKYGLSQYEKMVSAIDFWLGKLLQNIDLEQTLIILTSDHGEYIPIVKHGDELINLEPSSTESNLWKLGNKVPKNLYPMKRKFGSMLRTARGKLKSTKTSALSLSTYEKRVLLDSRMGSGHRVFDDLIRIPLLFSGCGISDQHIVSQQVKHVDIFPTILDLFSIKNLNQVDGISLVHLLKGKKMEEIPACIESPPSIVGDSEKIIGIRTSNYKYLKNISNSKESLELYDLQNDPLEECNISNENPEIVLNLDTLLQQLRTNAKIDEKEHDEEEIKKIEEKLKKLGYT